jgi:outer membrane autotransporter protein
MPIQAHAALILWDGDTSATWSNGANWVGGYAPANNINNDTAGFDFSILTPFQPNAGTRRVNGIVIGDGSTVVPIFEISGNDLTIGNRGIIKNTASLNTTISSDISLGAAHAWTNNSTTPLLLTGAIDNAGFNLTVNGPGYTRATGRIQGAGDLIKDGSGTLLLEGTSTFTGTTLIEGGTLSISEVENLGRRGTGRILAFKTGGTLQTTADMSFNTRLFQLGTPDAEGIAGTFDVAEGTTTTLKAAVSGAAGTGALNKTGNGTLALEAANTYTGGTIIGGGTIRAGVRNQEETLGEDSASITFNGTGASLQLAGNILNSARNYIFKQTGTIDTNGYDLIIDGIASGDGGLSKSGAGTLTLNSSNSYTGATTINSGTLSVNGGIANSAVTIFSGGMLAGSGLVGATTISTGGGISPGNSSGILDTGDLTLSGGGFYNWEIANVSGTPGTDWDSIRVGGGLGNATLTAAPADKFTIFVLGNPTGWEPSVSYSWNIIDWGGVTGFDANAFAVDLSGFGGAAPIGVWSLVNSGGFLKLGYAVGNPDWTGGSGNWSNGFTPPLSSGATLVYSGGGGTSINDIPAATLSSIGSISFSPGAGAYTLAANPGSAGHNASTPLILGGNITNNSTATQTIQLALEISGQSTIQAASGNIILTGPVYGAGPLLKTGAGSLQVWNDLILGGNIEVQQGLLSLNGRTTSNSVILSNGAMLGGIGRIEGNVLSRGTVSPGNSIGTLTIDGNYQQTSSGTLDIEIENPALFDRLVIGGQASLGGTLRIIQIGGNPLAYGQKYAFLETGGITCAFDAINTPEAIRGRFLSDGTTGTLLLAPDSYIRVAITPNQRNVAKALDTFIIATDGDRLAVSIALDSLATAQYPAAFEQIMLGFYESLANMAIEQAFNQTQMLNQRISSVRLGVAGFQAIGGITQPLANDKNGKSAAKAKGVSPIVESATATNWNAWALGTGMFSRTTDLGRLQNYNNDAGGFFVGSDYRWSENFVTGLYTGYDYSEAKYAGGSKTKGNSFNFGSYASYEQDGYYADTVVGGGFTNYETQRAIKFSTIDRTARANPNSVQFSAALNLGKDFEVGKFTLGPIAGAQYTYAGSGSFTESGAQSLDLSLGQQNANSLRSTLGGRIAYTWNLNQKIALIPEVRMFWQHEFLNNPRTINASLDGGSGPPFGYETTDPYRNSVFAGAGVTAQFGKNLSGSVLYNINFGGETYQNNMVSAGLNLSF